MPQIAFDIETLKSCFCICAKDTNGNMFEYCKVNDELVEPSTVRNFLDAFSKYQRLGSYNGTTFDLRVLAWIAESKTPISVQEISNQASLLISDLNIKGKNPRTSNCWKARIDKYRKNHFDVLKCYTDKYSLKQWELIRNWSVKETDVAWDKPYCTEKDKQDILFYCHHDVDATLKLMMEKNCQELIEAREWLISQANVYIYPDTQIAGVAEQYTYGNEKVDEVGIVEELIDWYTWDIPTYVLDMFMAIARGDCDGFCWNPRYGKCIVTGSDEYAKCLKLDKKYFDDWAFYGKGGAHYARIGLNKNVYIFDVASLYPSIIEHLLPLKTKNAQKRYVDGKHERIRIKRLKGTSEYKKPVDLGLKANLNSLSGKFRQQGAVAYAPNHGLAMCIIGQLLITEATWNAIGKNPDKWNDVVEINTDSFAVVNEDNIIRAREYCARCLENRKFEFEEEVFHSSYWKDVNHYVVYKEDGSIDFSKGDEILNSEPVIINSVYDMAKNCEILEEPYLVDCEWKDYLVKFIKDKSHKNATIDGVSCNKKYYYFMWVTSDCPDKKLIQTTSNVDKRKVGVVGFSPEELEKYKDYIDKEQYMDDLRDLCKVWHLNKLAVEPVKIKKVNMGFDDGEGLF